MLALEGSADLLQAGRLGGLARLHALFGQDFPRGAQLGLTLTRDDLRLEARDGSGLLRVPRPSVDERWLQAAQRLRGSMLVIADGIDLDPDAADLQTCQAIDAAARDARAIGAIVGFAEPRDGLPLLLG